MPPPPTDEPGVDAGAGHGPGPDADPTAPSVPVGHRRIRWGAVGGLAALAYVVAVAADALVLAADGAAYTDLHRRLDGLAPRIGLAVVLVGALGHLLDGGGRLVVDLLAGRGRTGVLDARLRLAVAFLVGALGVPLAVAVVWPALGGGG